MMFHFDVLNRQIMQLAIKRFCKNLSELIEKTPDDSSYDPTLPRDRWTFYLNFIEIEPNGNVRAEISKACYHAKIGIYFDNEYEKSHEIFQRGKYHVLVVNKLNSGEYYFTIRDEYGVLNLPTLQHSPPTRAPPRVLRRVAPPYFFPPRILTRQHQAGEKREDVVLENRQNEEQEAKGNASGSSVQTSDSACCDSHTIS